MEATIILSLLFVSLVTHVATRIIWRSNKTYEVHVCKNGEEVFAFGPTRQDAEMLLEAAIKQLEGESQ